MKDEELSFRHACTKYKKSNIVEVENINAQSLNKSRRRQWHPTPVFLPGESQGWGNLVGCHLWGRTELNMTEAT